MHKRYLSLSRTELPTYSGWNSHPVCLFNEQRLSENIVPALHYISVFRRNNMEQREAPSFHQRISFVKFSTTKLDSR